MKLDMDLVLFDFAGAFGDGKQGPAEQALYVLQTLLLDETTCRARIEFLRGLEEQAENNFQDLRAKKLSGGSFAAEIQAMMEIGTFPAFAQGLLRPERLAALSCDPDALWEAHQALTADDYEPCAVAARPTPTTAAVEMPLAATAAGFTMLARTGRQDELRDQLRPWLPALMELVELPLDRAEALLAFLLEQAKQLGNRRFRDALPGWLEEFGRQHRSDKLLAEARIPDWHAFLERAAVRRVLAEGPANEPEWARQVRRLALDEKAATAQVVLLLRLPEELAQKTGLPIFQRDLFTQIRQRHQEAARLFELN